ncbi:hypothetical protein CIK05_13370 [Bdellovibrio sp. qaytius]|nr:hypothetical protein CIK05_13370 [Bdellovibrio sp. qaytius]
MKILIVCPHVNDQVQFLASELEKMSLHVETVESVHPLRLVLNKYDLVHFIHNDPNINLKTVLSAWSAKAVGIATLLTTYCRLEPGLLQEFEFNFFDAVTLPYISELKKMRFYNGQKLILPSFPAYNVVPKKEVNRSTPQFVFPVLKSFDDLLKINLQALPSINSQQNLFIDAHLLRTKKETGSSSTIRKNWNAFLKKHPQYAGFKLFTEISTLKEVLDESSSYTFIHHLDLSSEQVAFWMETALIYNNFLILHEDQGTGFANFWKTEKNCYIYSPRVSAVVQLHTIDQLIAGLIADPNSPAKLSFDFKSSLDIKLNELARLYTKIVSQRASLMQPRSAKM